jgi:hypothetical protein
MSALDVCRGPYHGKFFLCGNSARDNAQKLPRSFSGLRGRAAGEVFETAGATGMNANLTELGSTSAVWLRRITPGASYVDMSKAVNEHTRRVAKAPDEWSTSR